MYLRIWILSNNAEVGLYRQTLFIVENMAEQKTLMNQCFVCKKEITDKAEKNFNAKTNLPVCNQCKGTEAEKTAEKDALDSLAEGFVCGCI
ncbi:hypothetical protein DDZ16_18260 [Marinilabilia rubra]|uniref:Uncharacterized protein n=2 Tax=Marinilabilia rubra TaxID=2162893 RepID=A0A2U2B4A7_9BACT|nr:hypothetical protein DDZ16_18260 [Marinilabilia rubra]